jgi:chaperonin GroEL
MKTTLPITGIKARQKILKGVNSIYDVVKLTLGPEGKNAILPRSFNRGPRHTNDGVTISDNIILKDPHERIVADFFKEGSKKTNELAGDGTTGTAVIAGHLINTTFKEMGTDDVPEISFAGMNPSKKGVRALRKEMKDAKDLVIEEVKKQAKQIKTLAELEKIAIISIGKEDEEVAKTVAKTVWEIARDANGDFIDNYIDTVEGFKGEIEVEQIRGMRFPAKLPNSAFITNKAKMEMVAEDVSILATNYKLDNPIEFANIMNTLQVPKLAIFAPEFSNQVLNVIIKAAERGVFIFPIKSPSLRTEQLEDMAVYTGGTVIDKNKGRKMDNVTKEDLGFAEKIVVKDTENKDDAILLGGKGVNIKRGEGNLVTERQENLKKQLKEVKNDLARHSLERRIANLSSAVGVIRVGASTNAELLYLKLKVEDGVNACKASLQEGYVKGGGLCLKSIAEKMPKNILTETLKAPYEQIQHNAGGKLDIDKDVIDPAKVVRLEVEHGISIAAQVITTDILIPEEGDKSPAEGYEAIAKAINRFTFYDAKHKGQLKENADFENEALEKSFTEAEYRAKQD